MKNRHDLRTANLGGRPTNEFKLACQSALKKGDAVGFALRLLKGTEVDYYVVDKALVPGPPRLAMRMEAAKWLADRGHGKATVVMETPDGEPVKVLTGDLIAVKLLEALPLLMQGRADLAPKLNAQTAIDAEFTVE